MSPDRLGQAPPLDDRLISCSYNLVRYSANTYYRSFAVSPAVVVREYSLDGLQLLCPIAPKFETSSLEPQYSGRPKIFWVVFFTTDFLTYIVSLVVHSSLLRFDRLPVFRLNMFTQ